MAVFLDAAFSAQPKSDGTSNVLVVQSDEALKELENLKQIDVDDIGQTDVDVSKHYIRGIIITAYESVKTRIRKTKKLVLKSCNSQQSSSTGCVDSIPVYIIGEDVNKYDILKPNNEVIIKGFSLEKLDAGGQNVQILVNLQNLESKIWMVRNNRCKDTPATKDKPVKDTGPPHLPEIKRRPKNDRNIELDTNKELKRSESEGGKSKEEISKESNGLQKVLVAGGKKLRIIQMPPKLHYTKLADIKENTNEYKFTVNVFAIVKYFKNPKKSKGKDYCMAISLVDDSFTSAEESFVCTVFAPSKEQLPAIKHVGDIVRFEGVNVSKFNGAVNGSGNSRHTFKWLVFDSSVDASTIPTASSSSSSLASNSHTLSEEEKNTIQNLKTWASLNVKVPPKRTLSQISPEELYFDIPCQVVTVCNATNASCLVLTVWDGTFPQCQSSPVAEIKKGESILSDDNAVKDVPERMTIDVHIYDEHSHSAVNAGDFVTLVNVHAIPPNSQIGEDTHKIVFIMHKGTINGRGVRKLSKDSQEVKDIQEQIASSISSRNQVKEPVEQQTRSKTDHAAARLPRTLQTSCTITDFPSIPFTSIEALKQSSKVPNKFRCRVKAMAFLPHDVKDFVQRCCSSCKTLSQVNPSAEENCQEATIDVLEKETENTTDKENQKATYVDNTNGDVTSSQGCYLESTEKSCELKRVASHYNNTGFKCSVCYQETHLVYVFSLLIEDPTGILNVMLFDSDVTDFLFDLPTPEEFLRSPEAQTLVHDSLVSITDNQTNELTAESQPEGGRPWMECCVMSYMIDQVVSYRMFGTTLI